MVKSNKDKQAAFKQRKREAGFVQLTVWIRDKHKAAIKELADKLNLGDGR